MSAKWVIKDDEAVIGPCDTALEAAAYARQWEWEGQPQVQKLTPADNAQRGYQQ